MNESQELKDARLRFENSKMLAERANAILENDRAALQKAILDNTRERIAAYKASRSKEKV
jgi:hypothetical protein